jgi:hypothetical protein
MCETCGCSDGAEVKVVNLETGKALDLASKHLRDDSHYQAHHIHDDNHSHDHVRDHDYDHDHTHHSRASTVLLEQDVLAKNAALAARNRAWFAGREILVLNLVSGLQERRPCLSARCGICGTNKRFSSSKAIRPRPMTACESDRRGTRGADQYRKRVSFGCRHGRAWPRRAKTVVRVQSS